TATWKTNVTFGVAPAGNAPMGYQWRFNGTVIPGATNRTLTLTNIEAAQAGAYSVILSNVAGTTLSSNAVLTIFMPDDHYPLSKLWKLAPGSVPYATGSSNLSTSQPPLQRGIAYNALSNQVYIVSRTGATTGLNINVLDGTTGTWLYSLNTTGISGGDIVLL